VGLSTEFLRGRETAWKRRGDNGRDIEGEGGQFKEQAEFLKGRL